MKQYNSTEESTRGRGLEVERCSLIKVELKAVVRHAVKNGAHGRREKRNTGRVVCWVLSAMSAWQCWEKMRDVIPQLREEHRDKRKGPQVWVLSNPWREVSCQMSFRIYKSNISGWRWTGWQTLTVEKCGCSIFRLQPQVSEGNPLSLGLSLPLATAFHSQWLLLEGKEHPVV